MESRMPCFYYSLILYNEWIIVRAMLSDGTERQSVMTVLTFKIQVESSRWNCTQDLADYIPKLGKLGGTK